MFAFLEIFFFFGNPCFGYTIKNGPSWHWAVYNSTDANANYTPIVSMYNAYAVAFVAGVTTTFGPSTATESSFYVVVS